MATSRYGSTVVNGVEYPNDSSGKPIMPPGKGKDSGGVVISSDGEGSTESLMDFSGSKAASDAAAKGVAAVQPVNWAKIYSTIAKTNLKLFPDIAATSVETALKTGFLTDEAMFGQIEKYFPGTMTNISSANAAISDLLAGQIPAATTQEIMRTSAETAEIFGIGPSPLAYSGALENIGVSSVQGIETGITASQNMAKLAKSMVFDYGGASVNFTNMLTDKTMLTPAEAIRAEQFNSNLALDKAVSILNYTFDQQKLESQKRMFRTAQRKETQRTIIEGSFALLGDILGSKSKDGGNVFTDIVGGVGDVFGGLTDWVGGLFGGGGNDGPGMTGDDGTTIFGDILADGAGDGTNEGDINVIGFPSESDSDINLRGNEYKIPIGGG